MLKALGCSVATHNGSKAGLTVSRRIQNSQHVQAPCLALLLCILACAPGATSRGLLQAADSQVGVVGPVRARDVGRIMSQTEECSTCKNSDADHRLGVVKEILSTSPKKKKPYWCVAKGYADPALILTSLNWACSKGGGVNCKPIQKNGSCFEPDTLLNHASYAFNVYYQSHGFASSTCDFNGAAQLVTDDPSTPGCVYLNSIVASNNTVYSSSLSVNRCSTRCIAAAVGSVLLYSITLSST